MARRAQRVSRGVGSDAAQTPAPPSGVDEIQRGKGQRLWTVLSDLVRGEVIVLQQDRTEDSLRTLLNDRFDARQRTAVQAVCIDMHRQ